MRLRLNRKALFCWIVAAAALVPCVRASDLVTSGTGVLYTLSDLAAPPGTSAVTGGPVAFTLQGNLTISPTDTLSIGPGESLLADDDPSNIGYLLHIKGRLLVQGLPVNHSTLSSHSTSPGSWRGILIACASGPASDIHDADIARAQFGIQARSAVPPVIDSVTFTDCRLGAVVVGPGFSAVVTRNTIVSSWFESNGVLLDGAAGATVSTNTLAGMPCGISAADGDAATLIADNETSAVLAGLVNGGSDASTIRGNTFRYGQLGAVASNDSAAEWSDNLFTQQHTANLAVVNAAAPTIRSNSFSQSGSTAGAYIMDLATPDFGSDVAAGQNVFQSNPTPDLVNFSPLNQMANGNTWSFAPPTDGIYEHDDDLGDLDGNGVVSGYVFLNGVAGVRDWMLYPSASAIGRSD